VVGVTRGQVSGEKEYSNRTRTRALSSILSRRKWEKAAENRTKEGYGKRGCFATEYS